MAAAWRGSVKGMGGCLLSWCVARQTQPKVGRKILAGRGDAAEGRRIFILDRHVISV
jgi:hypothetical protein